MEDNFDTKKLESVVRSLQEKILENYKHLKDKYYFDHHSITKDFVEGEITGYNVAIETINRYFNQNYAWDEKHLEKEFNKPARKQE